MSDISRRKLITTGLAATAGIAGLGVAVRMSQKYGLIPPYHGGIYGLGETLTYASQRLLTRHSARFCNAAAFARRRYGSGAGVIPWNEVPRNFPWASKFQVKIASPARAQAWHPLING
jgi:hypothetical protein